MTDYEFKVLMGRTLRAKQKYCLLLDRIEAEYELRFGNSPGEVTDETWIDTFHVVGSGNPTFEELMTEAESCRTTPPG